MIGVAKRELLANQASRAAAVDRNEGRAAEGPDRTAVDDLCVNLHVRLRGSSPTSCVSSRFVCKSVEVSVQMFGLQEVFRPRVWPLFC